MMETFAVVVAALVTGGAAKLLANRNAAVPAPARRPDSTPVWAGPRAFALVVHGSWFSDNVPAEYKGDSNLFEAIIDYPFAGAHYTDKIRFQYVLPRNKYQGYLFHFGGGYSIEDEAKREYILWEVMNHVEQTCSARVGAARDAETEHEDLKRELVAFTTRFKALVEADVHSVIAALKAGKQAKLKDWLNDPSMKAPESARGALSAFIADAERDVEYARSRERYAREAAVREAEGKVAAEREEARRRRLAGPIPFSGNAAGIVFGTSVDTGEDFVVPAARLQHTLISGVAGSGKSVMQHLLCSQFVKSSDVKDLTLIDLKGGIEFDRYSDTSKVRVIWKFADVVKVINDLMPFIERRQEEMRLRRLQNWPGPKSIIIIDEFAEIQTEIDVAETREEKATAKRLEANLVSISRRGRALGVVLICALQKSTTDSMPSGLRNNLSLRLVLRTATNALAASMLDDLEQLQVKPTALPTGRFFYYDASRGITKYLQAQIAPGVVLE